MKFSTIVEKDESTLILLQKKAEEYEEGRLLHSISSKHYDTFQVKMMTADIKEAIAKMSKEHIALLNFAASFNKEYATDNNQGFETAYRLFNRIRSTVSSTKNLYKKTCRRIQKSGKIATGEEIKPSVFSNSLLNESADLFGLDSYPEAVTELCEAMRNFFRQLMDTIKLCRKVIAREKEIREDPKLCVLIYQDCCNKALREMREAMSLLPNQPPQAIPLDEFTQKKLSATNDESLQQFICNRLHTLTPQQLRAHSYCEALSSGNKEGLTRIESKIFSHDPGTGRWIHAIIDHFDELAPQGRLNAATQQHKVSTKHIAILMLRFDIPNLCTMKEFVEDCFFEQYHGKYEKANYTSINSQYKSLTKNDEDYQKFSQAILTYMPSEVAPPALEEQPSTPPPTFTA